MMTKSRETLATLLKLQLFVVIRLSIFSRLHRAKTPWS